MKTNHRPKRKAGGGLEARKHGGEEVTQKKKKPPVIEIDMTAAGVTANRIRAVMGWPLDVVGSTGYLFKAWRAVGTGEALAISLEKVNEIAAEIEQLKAKLAGMEAERRVD